MPYNDDESIKQPDDGQKADAVNNKIKGWATIDVNNILLVKMTLFDKKPIAIEINAGGNFYSLSGSDIWKDQGLVVDRQSLLVVGYDDSKKAFKVLNSKGTKWGDNGFGWIDYQLFTKVCNSAFVVID